MNEPTNRGDDTTRHVPAAADDPPTHATSPVPIVHLLACGEALCGAGRPPFGPAAAFVFYDQPLPAPECGKLCVDCVGVRMMLLRNRRHAEPTP